MYKVGDVLKDALFYVADMGEKTTKQSKPRPYVWLVLVDAEGNRLSGNKWQKTLSDLDYTAGDTVSVYGVIEEYEEQLQIKFESIELSIFKIEIVPRKEGVTANSVLKEFKSITSEIEKGISKRLMNAFTNSELFEDFLKAPAAHKIHHAYECGLAAHSNSVTRIGLQSIPDEERNIFIVAAELHDIGKIKAYTFAGPTIKGTWEGKMLGHIVLGANLLMPLLDEIGAPDEFRTIFLNAIVGHHGKLEWGSPVLPKTRFTQILARADDYDAKATHVNEMDMWEEWSPSDKVNGTELWKF